MKKIQYPRKDLNHTTLHNTLLRQSGKNIAIMPI